MDLKSALLEKQKENYTIQEKLDSIERSSNNTRKLFEDVNQEYINYKKSIEDKSNKTENKIKELTIILNERDKLNRDFKSLSIEKENIDQELNKLKKDMQISTENLKELTEQRDELLRSNKLHEIAINNMKTQKDGINNELSYLKERSERDLMIKNNEIDQLNGINSHLKIEANSLKSTQLELKE